MSAGVAGLEFVDRLEETFDFIAGFVEVVGEHLCRFIATFDLGLQVLDRAVDVADAAGLGRAGRLERFERRFELGDVVSAGL